MDLKPDRQEPASRKSGGWLCWSNSRPSVTRLPDRCLRSRSFRFLGNKSLTEFSHERSEFTTTMCRYVAVFLTVCLGILIPVVASPMRVCFLDETVLLPGFTTYGESPTHKDKCCPKCGDTDEGESCCLDLKKLPDAEHPSGPLVLPPLVCCELDVSTVVPPCAVTWIESAHVPATPIRGPDSPGSWRALLSVWNI
jgi:hypothetical protein